MEPSAKSDFPRNAWYAAAWDREITGRLFPRVIANHPIVMYRKRNGECVALADACWHRLLPLSQGRLVDDEVVCGYHGLRYDASGRCVHMPSQETLNPSACVRSYPAVERHRLVWIWLGDPARADPARIPDLHWNADPAWASDGGLIHVRCNYKLVLDNLLSDTRRDPLAIRFYPTRSVSGIQGCTVVGFHLTNVASDPYVRFFRYWFNTDGSMSPSTITFISHEWLHWAQDQFSPGITARLPWWLVEGWPDYVGQSRSEGTLKFVLCQTATPTLKQLEDGADPNGPPELSPQYYAFANSMVEYLYATYGGKDAYRKLALAFKEDAVPANVFPKVLNVTAAKFYDDWKIAAKKKYC